MTNAPKCGQGLNLRTNERTNEGMNERTDGQFDFIMPQILFGGIKIFCDKLQKLSNYICIEGRALDESRIIIEHSI